MSYKKVLFAFVSILAILPSVVLGESLPVEFEADVVVYGASPGGLSAAAAAGREGRSVLLVEPQLHLGGLLGAGFSMFEDMPFRETLGGMTGWWFDRTASTIQLLTVRPKSKHPICKRWKPCPFHAS